MPLDPNILLQSQVPQNQNPLEQYSRVLALKNALGQGQLQQQQIQEGQIALRGQQALDSAYKNAFSKDADGNLTLNKDAVVNGLTQAGAGHLVPGVLKGFTEMDSAAADLKKKQTDAKTAADDYLASSLLTITDNKYDPKVAIGAIAHGAATGAIPQQQATQLAGQITADPTPETVRGLIDPLLSQSPAYQKLIDSRKTAQGSADRGAAATQQATTSAGKEKREAGQQQFQNAISDLAANPPKTAIEYRQRISALPTEQAMRIMEAAPIGQYDPATTPAMLRKLGMNPEQQTQADQAATNAANTEADRKVTQSQGAQRIAMEGQNIELRNKEYQQKYGDVLGNLSPDQLAVATKLAHGEMSPAQLSRYPDKEKLTAAAIRINPAWTQATYDTNQSFTNPEKSQAKNLGTISRIVGHIGRFEENSKDIGLAPGFAMGMKLTGPQSKLSEDSHAIAGELEKLVSGGVGSMEQTRAWQKTLSSPFPSARQQAVDEISQLIGSQYEGMNQTFKAGTGADLPIEKYVSPAGREWMKSKKINVAGATAPATASGGTVSVTDPNGGVHTFRSQADADKFKGLAGIK